MAFKSEWKFGTYAPPIINVLKEIVTLIIGWKHPELHLKVSGNSENMHPTL
jgi:hypothetical protein